MKNRISKIETVLKLASTTLAVGLLASCTDTASIGFMRQNTTGAAVGELNTKIDILWVIDNSSSMDPFQDTLRSGIAEFTRTYMNPDWDIRTAVITTDTYLAHPSFASYLDRTAIASGTAVPSHIQDLINNGKWKHPSSWGTTPIIDPAKGVYAQNLKIKNIWPLWGPDYAKLLPGNHDGPITGFCYDGYNYFFNGFTKCSVRDDWQAYNGAEKCLNPGASESDLSQCVNTVLNDTVRTGKPIISTMPPLGTPGDQAWIDQLVRNFTVNVTTGSVGHGSERGMGSLLQLLSDNEVTSTAFFRKDSVRAIIFVSDEEDQTLDIPTGNQLPTNYDPFYEYACDLNGLSNSNPGSTAPARNCCATCMYGRAGTSCPAKTVDDYTYTISVCPDDKKLMSVPAVQKKIDTFFNGLDGKPGSNPNKSYFIGALIPIDGASIKRLQGIRDAQDAEVGGVMKMVSVDRGDRYMKLGELVGNNSVYGDIGAASYTQVLSSIAKSAIYQRGLIQTNFTINPDKAYNLVKVLHVNGTELIVKDSQYEIQGKNIQITDIDLLMSLKSTDKISVNYIPYKRY